MVVDALELPFENEFDVVFSNAVLHWIPDQEHVLAGIRRSPKPGGRVLLQTAGRGNAARVAGAMIRRMTADEWRDCFRGFSFPHAFNGPEEYEPLLRKAGLVPLRVELVPKDMMHRGREGIAAWIRTNWLPFTHCVPEERRESFIYKIVDAFPEGHPLTARGWCTSRRSGWRWRPSGLPRTRSGELPPTGARLAARSQGAARDALKAQR